MERVLGLGGFFWKARDPKAMARWYEEMLGVTRTPTEYNQPCWEQERGPTVFEPFAEDTTFFPDTAYMLNFRVRDLDAMVAQLRGSGVAVEVDPETYPNGRFASCRDPEGNPIQLWEPEDVA